MKLLKAFKVVLLFLAVFFLAERFCRSQTAGFRPGKTLIDHSHEEKWDVSFSCEQNERAKKILSQEFYFLGSGVQCYAFLSKDGQTVLKIFKPYHQWPPNPILSSLPLPSSFKKSVILAREKRLNAIFESAQIAYLDLPEETGVFYLHLNRTKDEFPIVKLYDKLGICHEIPVDQMAFALQKKATLALTHFTAENGTQTIDEIFALAMKRCKKGIGCSDSALYKNVGFIENHAIMIDIGSLSKNPFLQKSYHLKREVLAEMGELKKYLQRHHPELLNHYYENVTKVLEQPPS